VIVQEGQQFKLGDKVRIRVKKVDLPESRWILDRHDHEDKPQEHSLIEPPKYLFFSSIRWKNNSGKFTDRDQRSPILILFRSMLSIFQGDNKDYETLRTVLGKELFEFFFNN